MDLRFADRFNYPGKETCLNFARACPEKFRDGFLEWLGENFHIYREFHLRADRLWNSGRRHYSARTIMEAIRFDTDLREEGGEFKINNSFIPDCSRLYQTYHNDRDGFFEMRVLTGSRRAA